MNKEPITKVIFRQFPDGDVIALFPTEAGTRDPFTCSSYMHYGKHGSASVDLVQSTTPASEQDYTDLKAELERIGYNLRIVSRFTRRDLLARIEQTKG